MKKLYSIGDIFRLGLLKNWDGEPYKHKATISKIVNKEKFELIKTRWGISKALSEEQIKRINKK